jgi:two-component system cell cycle sensor histidine kinase/response regulator CckA
MALAVHIVLSTLRVSLEQLMDDQLTRLASLPSHVAIPVIEMALPACRLSPNPAAIAVFPDLPTLQLAHPVLHELLALATHMHAEGVRVVTRDVQVGATLFHQIIMALPAQRALRVYTLDTTQTLNTVQWLAALVDAVPEAIIGLTLEGNIGHWNTGAQQLYGYAAGDMLGRSVTDLTLPERHAEVWGMLERLRHSQRVAPWETIHLHKDGTRLQVSLTVLPMQDAHGTLMGASVMAREITPRTGRAAQHAHQLAALSRLAGGAAQHFTTFLTLMLGYADLLREDVALASPAADKVQAIRQAGERAVALTRQLFAFSRTMLLEPRVLHLHTLMVELDTRLRHLLGPEIALTKLLDPRLGWVAADPRQLEQALVYLVVNARESMPLGGHLTIEMRNVELDQSYARTRGVRAGPYVLLAVSDTGCGMDAATQAQMFEPFFTTKPAGQGIGLSLAIVQGIVTHNGGHIDVTSAVEQGTTITLYLPRLPHDIQRPTVESGTLRLPRGTETIVLVEAEPRGRTWSRRTLEACGYTVLDASTGAEALRLVEQSARRVHLLVTEVDIPYMSGRQLAAHVTARYAGIPCLYIVDALDEADLHYHQEAEEIAVLHKPFTPAALVQKVREVLDSQSTP